MQSLPLSAAKRQFPKTGIQKVLALKLSLTGIQRVIVVKTVAVLLFVCIVA
jgi:hypothetical protein